MAVCLSCGKETEGYLCRECQQAIDVEDLCDKIRAYIPGVIENPNINPIWEQVASSMGQAGNLKDEAFALADYLPSPRKEYQKILCRVGGYVRVSRAYKPWFYETYHEIIDMEGFTKEEKLKLKGLMLETLYQDYRYQEADELASELLEQDPLPWTATYVIAEFFSQTRRYDVADDAICNGNKLHAGNDEALKKFAEISATNQKRRSAAETGKKEYLPSPKENKADAIKKYKEFMTSLGMDVKTSSRPTPIPKDEYPAPAEKREADFDSFVAFDLETTGKYPRTDAIIEVGAIRVIRGQIVESAAFTFQEFVKPFGKRLSPEISKLTGITKEDIKDAREMWEVIPDFMKFVGDDILVGYNSICFDAEFLCRAGRYSHEKYYNKHFDVRRYAQVLKDTIHYTGADFRLATLGEVLGIENPAAHRALADAITTAKIYLKLKEMSAEAETPTSKDDLLDLEEW